MNKLSLVYLALLGLCLSQVSDANELSSGTLIQLSSIGSVVVLTSAYTILKEYRRKKQ